MCTCGHSSVSLPRRQVGSETRVSWQVAGSYRYGMDIKEIMRRNLAYAVRQVGGAENLAEKAEAGSRKYFEQILAGYQGKKDKSPRAMGKSVAAAVERAIGKPAGWIYQEHADIWVTDHPAETPTTHCAVHESDTDSPYNYQIHHYSAREQTIHAIITTARAMDDQGLATALNIMRALASQHPIRKQKAS